jgi:hypothetical protein
VALRLAHSVPYVTVGNAVDEFYDGNTGSRM